jgi:glucokinase
MIVGVDIGGTKIAVGAVDSSGGIIARLETPTDAKAGYPAALDRVVAMLRNIESATGSRISGIGIGSTGPVYPLTGEIGDVNFFPNWLGQNPVIDLQSAFKVRAAIENDADAAALGEAGWGAGRNKLRLIYVTVGTGIGVGLIFDGRIYRGVAHSHPEIGHHVVDATGPLCDCGFHGCWESVAAGPAIVSWLSANAPDDYPYRSRLSAKMICELARAGDFWALRAVERESYYLGLGLANLVTLYVPDAIVLGGSVMQSADLFLKRIHEIIAASCRFVPHEKTEITLASLGEDANLIGAARVWYHRFAPTGDSRAE